MLLRGDTTQLLKENRPPSAVTETKHSEACIALEKIDFTVFEGLVLSEKVPALISPEDDGISAERVVFKVVTHLDEIKIGMRSGLVS